MAAPSKGYLAVLAIDFGTTYSGYVFSFTANQEKMFMSKNWGGPAMEYKTTTSLLVSKNGNNIKEVAFGYEAEDQYGESLVFADPDDDDGDEKKYLFRRFKMQLYDKKIDSRLKIQSVDGMLEISALEVFTLSLRCMKEKAKADIGKSVASGLKDEDVLWVLTLPAIWSEAAKDFMRTAAFKAGLIKSQDSKQLLLALEPEAASVYCRSKKAGCVFEGTPDGTMPPGTKYLVVDSGGGTVDIASHEVTETGDIRELLKPSGGDWGGTMVDRKFIKLFTDILGKEFVEKFKAESAMAWLQLLQTFERKKRDKSERLSMDIHVELSQKYKEFTTKSLEEAFKAYKDKTGGKTRVGNGYMVFPKDIVDALFNPVIADIINHVDGLLKKPELKDVACLMLVGGFSESHRLQQAFRDKFSPRGIKILIPPEPVLAVMCGAVMFGFKPAVIASRVAQHTYGFAVNEDFVADKHDRRKAVTGLGGQLVVKDVFSKFVTKGEELRTDADDVRKMQFYPSSASAHTGVLKLYSTDEEGIKYTYENGVKEVGCITIHVPANSDINTPMEVEISFGGTEIHVHMKDPKNSKQVAASAAVSFLQ